MSGGARFGLHGARLLVTGGTQGVGAAIAREAASQGAAAIAIAGRDRAKAGPLLAQLRGLGARAECFVADLARPDAPGALFARALDWAGGIDGLANAAGITDRASLLDGTVAQWDRLFAVNARAPFLTMQAMARHRLAAGGGGAIVNVGSWNAHCGAPELAIYAATKGALTTLTKNAAHAHLAAGLRANVIGMGWAASEGERKMQADTLGLGPGWEDAAAATRPLGRLLDVAEVARLATYLLSDYSAPQTGTVIDLEQAVLGAPP
ncbi:MAG: oxidoreductase [Paracoccaceae bacterium]